MFTVTDEQFKQLIADAMDKIPEEYSRHMRNLAVVWEDEPSPEQRASLHLYEGHLLFGLYEGVPLPQRGGRLDSTLPDKITLFKHSLEIISDNHDQLKDQVEHTLWHEVAHFFGLGHGEIARRSRRNG